MQIPAFLIILSFWSLVKGNDKVLVDLTEDHKQQLITAHNDCRNLVRNNLRNNEGQKLPKAINLKDLKWDNNLAKKIEAQLVHINELKHFPVNFAGEDTGQNIYYTSADNFLQNLKVGVDSFCNEYKITKPKEIRKLPSVESLKERVIYHFTQIVWQNTTKFACAAREISFYGYKYFLVCNYYPRGNWIGETVYSDGKSRKFLASNNEPSSVYGNRVTSKQRPKSHDAKISRKRKDTRGNQLKKKGTTKFTEP